MLHYHSVVRHMLLYLLILLLPIRGWAAESMAVQMVQDQISAQSTAESAMPADCPMLAKLDVTRDDQSDAQDQHSVCPSCQLCMSMTDAPSPTLALGKAAPAGFVVHRSATFRSADLVQQQKPPIS